MSVWRSKASLIIINDTVFKSSNVLNMNMKEKEVQDDGIGQAEWLASNFLKLANK